MEMTSMPVQPTWPARSISTGRGPAFPSALSRTISWPEPVRTVNRRPVPPYMAVEVLMATERLLETLWTVKSSKRVDRRSTRRWNSAHHLRAFDDERRSDGQQLNSELIGREQAHRIGRPTLALRGVQTVMAY